MIKRKKKEKIEFNTTALPDIVFMLLFFFMVVTVLKEKSDDWPINLPNADYSELVKQQDSFINVGICIENEKITYLLDNHKYMQLADLRNGIASLIKNGLMRSEVKTKIKIDKFVPMKEVNVLKSMLQDYQLYDIVYVIDKTKL